MTSETDMPRSGRDPEVRAFLLAVDEALDASDHVPEGVAAVGRIREALSRVGRPGSAGARRLPVCGEGLPEAYANARRHSLTTARVVDGFEALEGRLAWAPRGASGPHASANWPEGHANATIVGPGGLEDRSDVLVGVSLLAPHVRYPDHRHAPEEVYLVLSLGRFQHGGSGWFEPGIGGILHNEPNIRHAMASDAAPLLAVWLLWTGKGSEGVPGTAIGAERA